MVLIYASMVSWAVDTRQADRHTVAASVMFCCCFFIYLIEVKIKVLITNFPQSPQQSIQGHFVYRKYFLTAAGKPPPQPLQYVITGALGFSHFVRRNVTFHFVAMDMFG